ncbi:hypothetical protein EDB85DRAFT_1992436 [Lactarius pseudohatsudake]|nr:hypothetical protein EDB85DRAFT_1992436 [Lactarius pseudohatsudake]
MSEQPEDAKPKLNLVISLLESRITVKVKANMQFKKIFEVAEVCRYILREPRVLTRVGTLRFVYDGERLSPTDTPAERSMEDGDVIDAHLQQARTHLPSRCLFSHASIILSSTQDTFVLLDWRDRLSAPGKVLSVGFM